MTEPQPVETQRSRVARRWVIKIAIIGLIVFGSGLAFLYDATIGYPKRGANAAEFAEFQFLQQLVTESAQSRANIPDGKAALADLEKKQSNGPLTAAETLERDWLNQLSYIHKLEPASASTAMPRTDFRGDKVQTVDQRVAELKARWTTAKGATLPSSPLSPLDIFFQWVVAVICLPIGLWMFLLIIIAKSRVFRWDPAEQRLTLPGGNSIVPADIAEFDKRKWHRLYISLKIKPSHPQLGGKDVELDLLRYEPVEEWVLAMERTAFPESAPPPEPEPAPTPTSAPS